MHITRAMYYQWWNDDQQGKTHLLSRENVSLVTLFLLKILQGMLMDWNQAFTEKPASNCLKYAMELLLNFFHNASVDPVVGWRHHAHVECTADISEILTVPTFKVTTDWPLIVHVQIHWSMGIVSCKKKIHSKNEMSCKPEITYFLNVCLILSLKRLPFLHVSTKTSPSTHITPFTSVIRLATELIQAPYGLSHDYQNQLQMRSLFAKK
jgi:hypothetical protein